MLPAGKTGVAGVPDADGGAMFGGEPDDAAAFGAKPDGGAVVGA